MMVISGVPCDNTTGTVSTNDARTDWVTRKFYRFKTIATASNVLKTANNLTTYAVGAENTMNVDTGVPITFDKI